MRPLSRNFLLLALGLFLLPGSVQAADESTVYELRTYYAHPGKLDALHSRFRDHTLKLFADKGMTNVAYWVPTGNDENKLIYLMAYPSRKDRAQMWKAFLQDPAWKAAYAASTAEGKLVARIESEFLTPTDYSPALNAESAATPRLFELRRYTTREGKLPNLDARFRDHTIKLFERHGMTNLIYFHLMDDQEGHENTLLYFLAHESEDSRQAGFDQFRQDPDWQSAREASEKDGKILIKGGVESILLSATDYSPLH